MCTLVSSTVWQLVACLHVYTPRKVCLCCSSMSDLCVSPCCGERVSIPAGKYTLGWENLKCTAWNWREDYGMHVKFVDFHVHWQKIKYIKSLVRILICIYIHTCAFSPKTRSIKKLQGHLVNQQVLLTVLFSIVSIVCLFIGGLGW